MQEIRRFIGWGTKHLRGVEETKEDKSALFHRNLLNYYQHVNRLLKSSGALKESPLQEEDKQFFTERVAAHFFEGIFPGENHSPMNSRRNEIDKDFRKYVLNYLPFTLIPSPNDPIGQFEYEQQIDFAAAQVFNYLYLDLLNSGITDQLTHYFIGALKGEEMPLFYGTPNEVKRQIKEVMIKLNTILASYEPPQM